MLIYRRFGHLKYDAMLIYRRFGHLKYDAMLIYRRFEPLYVVVLSISTMLLDFKIRQLLIIFELLNKVKWKLINYKILRLVKLYNFGIKYDFIQNHKDGIYLHETIFGGGWWCSPALKMVAISGYGWCHDPSLKIYFQKRVNWSLTPLFFFMKRVTF